MNIPTGNVTFLFTDIEGSTKLSQEFPETLQSALEKHHSILRTAIESNNGFIFEIVGDAFCCAFENANDAVKAAVDAQLNLSNENWNDTPIKVRIGIHSGNSEWNVKSYSGYITLARCARVMSAAYGEQIIISNDTYELVRKSISNEISFRDLGERRLKDVIQPIRLFQIISKILREDFPPLKTLDARPNNLPIQLTSFIGRENVMYQIKNYLKSSRLITLLGSGGAGKTRLAMQIGADMIDDFENGVFLSELDQVTDPHLLAQSVVKSTGATDVIKKSAEATLIEHLKDKEMLLVLDNCEHVITECAILAELLLSSCPKLKVIATSREALKCSGEQTFSVPSLSLPQTSENISAAMLSQYEAVRLFMERALSVNPHFSVNDDNSQSLADICNNLDGIPLAIELAAARTKMLSVEKIRDRLDDRFRLLTGGRRTALPRQQTLKALIDWSYDLLSEEEKILWKRLSVFSGGFDLEAVEEICSDDVLKKESVLELLGNLNEKSILIFDGSSQRYKMLESIRQYGRDLLNDTQESEIILIRHLLYYLSLAEASARELQGPLQKKYLDRLESENGNFQSALSWSINESKLEEGVRLAIALSRFWIVRGYSSTGNKWFDNILTKEEKLSGDTYVRALDKAGNFKLNQGEYSKAFEIYEECLELKKKTGNKKEIAGALNNLGAAAARRGDYEKAKPLFEEYLMLIRESGEEKNILTAINNLSILEIYLGNFEEARLYCNEGINLSDEVGDDYETYFSFRNSGILEFYVENYGAASEFHGKALSLSRKNGFKSGISVSLTELGTVKVAQKELKIAGELLEESLAEAKNTKENICIAMALSGLGSYEFESGNYDQARTQYESSLKLYREIEDKTGIVGTLKLLGNTLLKLKDLNETKEIFKECLKDQFEMGMKREIPLTLIVLSEIYASEKNFEPAVTLLGIYDNVISSSRTDLKENLIQRYDQQFSSLKEKLGEERFVELFQSGKMMTIGQLTANC